MEEAGGAELAWSGQFAEPEGKAHMQQGGVQAGVKWSVKKAREMR